MVTFLARIRAPLSYLALVLIAGAITLIVTDPAWADARVAGAVSVVGIITMIAAMTLTTVGPARQGPELALASPVRGRWRAVNSPVSRVPSHGTHAYGQTYAVDLIYAPDDVARLEFAAAGGSFRAPDRFPTFGRGVYAPADATVVRASDWRRDHRSRSSWMALIYFFAEGALRELAGPSAVLGNHLVLRLADGSHFVMAHLRRGSVRVSRGDRVACGQLVAACGNSGNTTEPHLHCGRQDRAAALIAAGLPWTITPEGIPANGSALDMIGPTELPHLAVTEK